MKQMKRIFLVVLVASLPFVSCIDQSGNRRVSEKDSLRNEIYAKDSLLDEVFATLNEITANLNEIKVRENLVTSTVDNAEIRKEPTAQISEDIAVIDSLLIRNREMIVQLQGSTAQLKKANARVSQLEKLIIEMTAQIEAKDSEIADLKHQIAQKDKEIGILMGQVDGLNTWITDLSGDNHQLQGDLETQKDIANTGYYIVGAQRELLDKEIVYKTGFIGRTMKVNENRSLENFTQVDIRTFDEVIIGHKKVELITVHPSDSYTLVMDDQGVYTSLVITDRARFWEYSKVLVISYKQ